MVDRDGQVKLLDFGMAKAIGESPALGPRRVAGRYGHLSPELVRGDNVDRPSDLFSTGVLLWEALAGRSLFEDSAVSDAEGMRRVLRSPIPELRSLRAGLPKRLSALVSKALQRDPARRFATAEEFAVAIESAVAPTSPTRLAALVTSLGAQHFEPSRQALAAVRHSLPPPLTRPQLADDPDAEEATLLALTGRFHADSLSPANADASSAPRLSRFRPVAVALGAAALAASLMVAFHNPGRPPAGVTSNGGAVAARALAARPSPLALPSTLPASRVVKAVEIEAPRVSQPPALHDDEPAPRPLVERVLPRPPSRARAGAGTLRATACSPPTFLGQDGIRHFKDQCL
jgi:serine/threonine-protein kinase